jgi:hypothetical protein
MLVDVSSGKSRCGPKKIEVDVSTLSDLPMSSRTTIHDVAHHFGVSKSKLHAMKHEGITKRVSNTIKPYITDNNKNDMLKWCLSMLDPRRIVPHDPTFQGLFDYCSLMKISTTLQEKTNDNIQFREKNNLFELGRAKITFLRS